MMSEQKGAFVINLAATTATTAGAVAAVANPEGVDLIITRVTLRTTAHSTGAATLDIGVAADAATASDILLDGIAVGTAAKVADNINDAGTNGKARQVWGATQFLTATGSASTAGMVGKLYVEYIRA
jgi:hypothetical protein